MECWIAAIVITALFLWGFYWISIKAGNKALAQEAAHAKKLSDQRKRRSVQNSDPLNKEKPLISLVLLLKEGRYIDEGIFRTAAENAWGVEIPRDNTDVVNWIVSGGPPGHFLMKVSGVLFLIINMSSPYFDNAEENAQKSNELWTRKILTENRAWMAFDWMQSGSETDDKDHVYRMLAKLLLQFADDNCLAIYQPEFRQFTPCDDQLLVQLASDNPLQVLAENRPPPVMHIEKEDPAMQAAVQQAQTRWPEFVLAFESRGAGFKSFVKAPFSDGKNTEFMWFEVTAIEGDQILGVLNNQPVNLSRFKLGQRVRSEFEKLNDWLFIDAHGQQHGGFTIEVVKNRGSR